MGDFMVAGGVILFCLAMVDLTSQGETRRGVASELGAVPIGTPLVVGPAVLTISLMLVSVHGLAITLIALFLNIAIVGIVFIFFRYPNASFGVLRFPRLVQGDDASVGRHRGDDGQARYH